MSFPIRHKVLDYAGQPFACLILSGHPKFGRWRQLWFWITGSTCLDTAVRIDSLKLLKPSTSAGLWNQQVAANFKPTHNHLCKVVFVWGEGLLRQAQVTQFQFQFAGVWSLWGKICAPPVGAVCFHVHICTLPLFCTDQVRKNNFSVEGNRLSL